MAKMKVSKPIMALVVVLMFGVGMVYGNQIILGISEILGGSTGTDPITGTGEYSRFTGVAVAEDSPTTKIQSEVLCAWYDWNGDGAFSFSEVEQIDTAATTGIFTSGKEYPIGLPIYIQLDDAGEEYQTQIKTVQMAGTKNSDGSAKSLGNLAFRATDDGALSYYGLVGGKSIDDGTDYNATLDGADEQLVVFVELATADAGFDSQTNSAFGADSQHSWLSEKEMAPTFFGMYMTNQDAIDLGLSPSEFDYYHVGATNTFCAIYVSSVGDGSGEFYDSDASNAPTWEVSFGVEITASGALIYAGMFQDVELDDFQKDVWGPTTDATILGTLGADWDWTVV